MYYEFTKEELLDIIFGKVHYLKCPSCDNNGWEYWNENGEGVGPYPRPEWGNNYNYGECANCDGLGYVPKGVIEN